MLRATMAEEEEEEETDTDADSDAQAETDADADADAETDGDAEEVPGAGTPEGDSLREALAAFERGDYVGVREIAESLVEAKDDEVANYARDLVNRTRVDPVQIGVVLACLALFAYIVYTYVL
jgi:hypothetical protein